MTEWLIWFLQTLEQALLSAQTTTNKIISKAKFWQPHRQQALNTRQVTEYQGSRHHSRRRHSSFNGGQVNSSLSQFIKMTSLVIPSIVPFKFCRRILKEVRL
ncbi:hypothetical protein [Psychrobacter sp. NG27]|uniref:hypothetical protein n=1 Tax=Psychrobacter sp. NG27 TaxID=2781966 RepID=UPI0018DFE574|nr:hypothetical protein [Psychrobacter sp. NG27]MBI0426491.1 hypothetical protein [Psychrobacter sp. NG27]